MSFADGYLNKHAYISEPLAQNPPKNDFQIAVIIPCYNEPAIIQTLASIAKCHLPESLVEVYVIINASETAPQEHKSQNQHSYERVNKWINNQPESRITFAVYQFNHIPEKHAGVGLARKIGMDEAIRRFNHLNNPGGIMVSLDADCLCSQNYLIEIEKKFFTNKKLNGANIHVEHDIKHHEISDPVVEAVTVYELYLRYYVEMLRFTGFPYGFHTIGSGFAVKAHAYVKQGGMNRRKGGEDFYFLQKLFALGNFCEINSTRVIPAARLSDRVPFGTGPELKKIINNNGMLLTYVPGAFMELKDFFSSLNEMFNHPDKPPVHLSPLFIEFLENLNFSSKIGELKKHTAGYDAFRKRFFQWFNAFMILKYLNVVHENKYTKQDITQSLKQIFPGKNYDRNVDWLMFMREKQKNTAYSILQ